MIAETVDEDEESTEEIKELQSLGDLVELLKAYREYVIRFKQDMYVTVCGYEGSGKSSLTVALNYLTAPERFSPKNLTFLSQEYIKRQLHCEYLADPAHPGDYDLKTGDGLVFDEGGTQANSRNFATPENIALVTTSIANRCFGLMHYICVPKPKSLDEYLREERVRLLLFVHAKAMRKGRHVEGIERSCMVYFKSKINRMMSDPKWKIAFRNAYKLRAYERPDAEFSIPDLQGLVPGDVWQAYEAKKKEFSRTMLNDALLTLQGGPAGGQALQRAKSVYDKIVQDDPEKYVKSYKKQRWISRPAIQLDYGLSSGDAALVKEMLERGGYL